VPEHGRDDILDEVNPRSCLSFSRRATRNSVRPNRNPCKGFFREAMMAFLRSLRVVIMIFA